MMIANRQAMGLVMDPQPRRAEGKKVTKVEKAKEREPGTKAMRYFIIEEKPGKKVVRDHFKALVELECVSESDSD